MNGPPGHVRPRSEEQSEELPFSQSCFQMVVKSNLPPLRVLQALTSPTLQPVPCTGKDQADAMRGPDHSPGHRSSETATHSG